MPHAGWASFSNIRGRIYGYQTNLIGGDSDRRDPYLNLTQALFKALGAGARDTADTKLTESESFSANQPQEMEIGGSELEPLATKAEEKPWKSSKYVPITATACRLPLQKYVM